MSMTQTKKRVSVMGKLLCDNLLDIKNEYKSILSDLAKVVGVEVAPKSPCKTQNLPSKNPEPVTFPD